MEEDKEQWEFGWLTCSRCDFTPAPTDVNVQEDYYCSEPKYAGSVGEKCGGIMEFRPMVEPVGSE